MADIGTSCPMDGEVTIPSDNVAFFIDPDSGEGNYWFKCPKCKDVIEKRADKRIIALLRSVNVKQVKERSPDSEAVSGSIPSKAEPPQFTYDDVLDFHEKLQDDAAIERWLNGSYNGS